MGYGHLNFRRPSCWLWTLCAVVYVELSVYACVCIFTPVVYRYVFFVLFFVVRRKWFFCPCSFQSSDFVQCFGDVHNLGEIAVLYVSLGLYLNAWEHLWSFFV